ncbi:MAG: TonB family protein [Blastocatellia bacterium]
MKICLKCQQQFPNGFQYCPNDTEHLITQEEYIRRTRPISAPPVVEPPVAEVVPITNPFQREEAQAANRPPQPAPSVPVAREPQNREAPSGTPYRRTEPIIQHHQQNAPRPNQQPFNGSTQNPAAPNAGAQPRPPIQSRQTSPQGPLPTQPQTQVGQPQTAQFNPPNPTGYAANTPPRIPQQPAPGAALVTTGGLSFSVPDQGSLFSRLVASLKNIGEAFRGGGKVTRSGAGDFQFLLPEESLIERVGRELSGAWQEFRANPRRFLAEFVKGEGSNRFRRNALLAGSEMALVGYVTIYFISQIVTSVRKVNSTSINLFFIGAAVYLGLCYLTRGFLLYKLINRVTGKLAAPKLALEIANWAPIVALLLFLIFRPNFNFYCLIFPGKCYPTEEEKVEEPLDVTMLSPETFKVEVEKAPVEKKQIGGSKPKPKPASGGGGGGRQQPTPPSKGVPPQMALTPQIIPPNPEPPKIKNPSMVVVPTIYGDPKALPPMKGPIGDPTGVPAPPSSGPGAGAGIGRGQGTGVGGGEGGGAGPGRGGNTGGGNMGIGGGGSIEPMTASVRPKILYQEKAKYTEEARQNKVQGVVMLSVIFTADGQIANIRTVRGLPDGLTEKAIEAARKIRFQPAVKNGQPVSVRGTLEFSFNLY